MNVAWRTWIARLVGALEDLHCERVVRDGVRASVEDIFPIVK